MRNYMLLSFWFGLIAANAINFVVFHIGESRCQQEHNVADCVYTETPFVPYVRNHKGTD